jgi:AAA15 family ATPase/GTPase
VFISISVENFRSIVSRQEVSFVAARYKGHESSLYRPDLVEPGLLPVLVFYGANAAGKTGLIKALSFIEDAVTNSHNRWKPNAPIEREPHFFHRDQPSRFEIEFLLDNDHYRFGFSCTEELFEREWLYVGKSLLYERTRSDFHFGSKFRGSKSIKSQTRDGALFLSTAVQNNHPMLSPIFEWISSWECIKDETRFQQKAFASMILKRPRAKAFVESAMRVVNSDIHSISPQKSDDQLVKEMPENFRPLLQQIHDYSRTLFTHIDSHGRRAELAIDQESRGTQTYFHLIGPIIASLATGRPIFIDEMDASLHPSLLKAIVTLFQSTDTNPYGSQLLFNTHDTTLLTPELFRPDQVWFVEKKDELGTEFFPLGDFEGVRSDTKVQRAYLEGRFGALPFIDSFKEIFASEVRREGHALDSES